MQDTIDNSRKLSQQVLTLMDENYPYATEPRVSGRTTGTFDIATGKLSFVAVGNEYDVKIPIDPVTGKKMAVREVYVHNGDVWNGGESDLAKAVFNNSETLETIYYCPNDTKGGVMIRPPYHKGQRNGVATFPVLVSATINSSGMDTFSRCWIAPELKRLEIAFQKQIEIDVESIFNELKVLYPKLETVRIFVKQTNQTIAIISSTY